ncbi:MAG: hypothetical protein Alpg2KO_26960 [Alphaproteobacteria bacterium]
MNEIWLLDGDRVLRRAPTSGPSRLTNERLALTRASDAGLPAPRPLDWGQDKDGRDWLLVEQMPGTPLIDLWPDLPRAKQLDLAAQAGVMLARLHEVETGGHGLLNEQEATGGFASWQNFLADCLDRWSKPSLACGFLQPNQLERLQSIMPILTSAASQANGAQRMVHSDYHLENVLSDGETITAIIDFEWCYGGDPMQDFHIEPRNSWVVQGSHPAMTEGYYTHAPDPGPLAHERRWLNRALLAIEQAPDQIARGDKQGHAESIALLFGALMVLEPLID